MSRLPIAVLAATAALFSATPALAQLTTIRVCVIEATDLREIEAQYNTMTGDTTVAGRLFREVHPVGSAYAAAASWYVSSEAIDIDGARYVKYGLPRVLGITEVTRFAEYEGVGIFAEAGARGLPEVVYVPVRTGCEFQPYQREVGETRESTGSSGGRAIEIPRAVGGALEPGDDMWNDRLYDDYVFAGDRGRTIVAEMRSGQLDAVLHLGQLVDGEFRSLGSSDDGFGTGTDSRLVMSLPASGDYVLRATSFDYELGGYSLLLSEEGSEPSRAPGLARIGSTLDAELTLVDAVHPDDKHYDEYLINVRADQRLVITLSSDDFDTYLTLLRRIGNQVEIASNDDAPDMGTDSRIDYTFDQAGTYVIVASSYAADRAGAYELRVEPR